jgi:hypothetical protein
MDSSARSSSTQPHLQKPWLEFAAKKYSTLAHFERIFQYKVDFHSSIALVHSSKLARLWCNSFEVSFSKRVETRNVREQLAESRAKEYTLPVSGWTEGPPAVELLVYREKGSKATCCHS